MKLTFQKIKIHNFLSYKDEEFNFEDKNGLNLICGRNHDIKTSKNGVGKSALFSALVFALFGQTPNKVKTENIAHRLSPEKESTYIVLEFLAGNDQYKIETGLKTAYKNSYCNVYKQVNGEYVDLTKSSIIETRKFIEKEIINCDLSIFLRTIILSSDQNYNFFLLKAQDKREFIENLFDISDFGRVHELIKSDIRLAEKSIYGLESSLISLHKNHDIYEQSVSEYKTKCENDISVYFSKIDSSKADLAKYESSKNEIVNDPYDLTNKLIKLEDAKVSLIKSIENTNTIKNKLLESKLQQNSIINNNKHILDSHEMIMDKLCDDCRPLFDKTYKVTDAKNNIAAANEKLSKVNDGISAIDTKMSSLDDKLATVNEKINLLNKKKNEDFKKSVELDSLISKEKQQIEVYEKQILTIQTNMDVNPYVSLIETNTKNISETNKKIEDENKQYAYLKYAGNIVSQDTIKKFIIKDMIGLVNSKIQYYINKLGAKFTCIFDENMDYKFITESGETEYGNFSSGERMRLTIATSFAFRDFLAMRSNFTSNILILDEYIDSNIDKLAVDGIIEILKEFSALYNQNIFVISHRKEVLDNSIFNNIIIIEKRNEISKITYENKGKA